MTGQTQTLKFEELPIAVKRAVYWAFFWRGLVTSVCGALGGAFLGAIIGFVIGFVTTASGHDIHEALPSIRIVGAVLGLIWGLLLIPYLVRWIFRYQSNEFAIRFVRLRDGSTA